MTASGGLGGLVAVGESQVKGGPESTEYGKFCFKLGFEEQEAVYLTVL